MAALFVVQFLSWSAMFAMWITAVPVIAEQVLRLAPGNTSALQPAILVLAIGYAGYAMLGVLGSFVLPRLVARFGHGAVLGIGLLAGAAGLAALAGAHSTGALVPAFLGIGVGWSVMGAIPYAVVAKMAPEGRGARTLRIFGLSTVLPQVATTLGLALALPRLFAVGPSVAVLAGAGAMALGGIVALAVRGWFAPADIADDDW